MSTINQQLSVLQIINPFLFFCVLFFGSLYLGSSFLIPLSIAILLALMLVPVGRWLEGKGLNRTLASFLALLLVVLFFVAVFSVVTYQVSSLAENWEQTKKQITGTVKQISNYLDRSGISTEWISQRLEQISESSGSDIKNMLSATVTTLGKFFLLLIYTYLLLFNRHRFRKFFQKLIPQKDSAELNDVFEETSQIAQAYLFGKFLLIIILSVLYVAGFMILGIKYAVVVAIIAGVLSIIPYFGNIIGGGLAMLFALITSSSIESVLGVVVVMVIAQLLENYVLTPLIVGRQVDLNPFFTILIVVFGGAIWGISGTIVAVPYLGITKILFDHIPALHPYGYLVGDGTNQDNENESIVEETKSWVEEKVS